MENEKWKRKNAFLLLMVFAFAFPAFAQKRNVKIVPKTFENNMKSVNPATVFQPSLPKSKNRKI